MKSPAFQFYVDNFVEGTTDLTAEEVGAYIRLLCAQWSKGAIPNDIKRLCLITGANEATTNHVVRCKFVAGEDGLLRNARMTKTQQQSEQWRLKSSKGGQVSAAKRVGNSAWGNGMVEQRTSNEPINEPPCEPATITPSPTPSPPPNGERVSLTRFPEVEVPSWLEVCAECGKIGLVEWRAKDWFDEMQQCGWKDNKNREVMSWRAYLARVKSWWERDGRPMNPPTRTANSTTHTPMSIKTIIQAKKEVAAQLRTKFCSDTAIDSIWSDPEKRKEFFAIQKEIKSLNNQLSNMA